MLGFWGGVQEEFGSNFLMCCVMGRMCGDGKCRRLSKDGGESIIKNNVLQFIKKFGMVILCGKR